MRRARSAAEDLGPLLRQIVGQDLPIGVRFWDGSRLGPEGAGATLVLNSPRALRRLLFAPRELGAARAYVAGDIDIEGDIYAALNLREVLAPPDSPVRIRTKPSTYLDLALAASRHGALGLPLPPPAEEVRLHGALHSRSRDARAISHHYDVSNDFYRLFLGETLTYSCAYFASPDLSLDEAQLAKYDLICRKLGLVEGMRLLDVGCGWGGMAMHAARNYGVSAVGVTLSSNQAELASKRVAEEGLSSKVEIRLADYREVDDGPYDAISSIGMFEHVGLSKLGDYLSVLRRLLRPGGRLLNHGISRPPGPAAMGRNSFISRYVFPDGELHEVGTVVSAIQATGLEVRDVESLREHYARTLRHWVANLEADWPRAVTLAGLNRARVWRLYMAGSALHFEAARTSIHQVLAVKTGPGGESGIPLTRSELLSRRGAAA